VKSKKNPRKRKPKAKPFNQPLTQMHHTAIKVQVIVLILLRPATTRIKMKL
jgi:hypothetical protein